LVTLEGQQAGSNPEYGYRQVAQLVDLVIHIERRDDLVGRDGRGQRRRFVSEILAVGHGEYGRPSYTPVFTADAEDQTLRPDIFPHGDGLDLTDLARYGYNPAEHRHGAAL